MRFQDIPQMTKSSGYAVDVSWHYLPSHYANAIQNDGLEVCPDFQRNYVWRPEQKTRYVEFILRGGTTGKDLYTNCPGWHFGRVGPNYADGEYVLVDGKQRLDAVLSFLNNEFPVFGGNYHKDYSDHPDILDAKFRWHVNYLPTREEILQWYIDLNTGGTVHTEDEISRVRAIKDAKLPYSRPSHDEIKAQAGLDRKLLQDAIAEDKARWEEIRSRPAPPVKKGRKGK